jgi:DNA-binding LytR/AlgR family response regulator
MTITEVEAMLPSALFIRIHRSFIVALSKIDKIERHQVMVNGAVLPVGSLYYPNITELK